MNISPVIYSSSSFEHRQNGKKNVKSASYSFKDKAIVATTSALGVAGAMACLAKHAGYSLKPSKIFKNIKQSYFSKADFEAPQVISLGVGTCLGGLAGGYIIDKDKDNRSAKKREAIMQIGNISIPILTVACFAKIGQKFGKAVKGISAIAGLFAGVYTANYLMNKLGNAMFKNKNERGVKPTDFSAHVDDMVLAATYVNNNKYVHGIGRIVPFALVVPGFEVGTRKLDKDV